MKKSGGFPPSLQTTPLPSMPLDREYTPAMASVHPQLSLVPPRLRGGARTAGAPVVWTKFLGSGKLVPAPGEGKGAPRDRLGKPNEPKKAFGINDPWSLRHATHGIGQTPADSASGSAWSLLRAVAVTRSRRWAGRNSSESVSSRLLPARGKARPAIASENQTNPRKRLACTVHGACAMPLVESSPTRTRQSTWRCMVIATSCER